MNEAAPKVRLTRRYRFSASHRLHADALGEEENRAVYGKCNNPHGHGHNYLLEVSWKSEVDAKRGRMVAVDELDEFVRRSVLRKMDRRNLNVEVEEFAALVPTTENLALVVARRLERDWATAFPALAGALEKIRIHETKNNIFETRVGG